MKQEEIIFKEDIIYEVRKKTQYETLPITEGIFKVILREVHSSYVMIKAIKLEDYHEKYGFNRIENTVYNINEIKLNDYYKNGYIKLLNINK